MKLTPEEEAQLPHDVRGALRDHAAGRSLSAVLKTKENNELLQALLNFYVPPGFLTGEPWEIYLSFPAESKLVTTLCFFGIAVTVSGIDKVLVEARGLFDEIAKGCRQIGAWRASEYLELVQMVFPDGIVPPDAESCLEAIHLQDDISIGRAISGLNKKYRSVSDEVAENLREYIGERLEMFEAALPQGHPRAVAAVTR
jgi:hypothetical protein